MDNDYLPCKGWESHLEINESGSVRNIKTGRLYSPRKSDRGFYEIHLYYGGKHVFRSVHRLLAETFLPNPKRYKYVHFKDGNKDNITVSNLEWNNKNGKKRKLSDNDKEQIKSDYIFRSRINGSYALANKYGVSHNYIIRLVKQQ